MTWTLAWKDERLEREPSVGAVWLREAKDEGPRVVCAGVRLRSEDIAWPTAKGEFSESRAERGASEKEGELTSAPLEKPRIDLPWS